MLLYQLSLPSPSEETQVSQLLFPHAIYLQHTAIVSADWYTCFCECCSSFLMLESRREATFSRSVAFIKRVLLAALAELCVFDTYVAGRACDSLIWSEELQGVVCMLTAAGRVFSCNWGHISSFFLPPPSTKYHGSASPCAPSALRFNHRYTNCDICVEARTTVKKRAIFLPEETLTHVTWHSQSLTYVEIIDTGQRQLDLLCSAWNF